MEQTGYQHQDGGGCDVGGRGLPATADASGEGDKHEEESNNEECNHCPHHMNSCHLFLVECLGDVVLVRDEVVHIPAPGLHEGHGCWRDHRPASLPGSTP